MERWDCDYKANTHSFGILFVQVTQEFIETERLFNKPELSFGYFVVYTPVR